ncbi:MAG: restriction endonuclease [Rhodobacteraceae bacterium]|jgi:restriction system protein|uniref:Restriction system protein n=1 Tax=Salipiger profundus TaxID=1229727 RepID=A0A1U7D8L5_9RHOB|nr:MULTISPECIES: restriction endonuclease [Salipiger]APX24514.1 restriction system protein [Salipiger profundus]MAB07187.1 restriction endonuclease [Paracoccaceae bacterium]GGA19027.1 hypothetical protein GCM10011326_34540 [Salipiger profundus]SFD40874.1 Restriction endonuclease [Salipiger profundus]
MKKDHEPALGLITVAALGAAGYAFYTLDTFTAAAIALPAIVVTYLVVLFAAARLFGLTLSAGKKRELARYVRTHSGALSKNLRLAVRKNDYGRIEADEREECVREFLDSIELSFNPWRVEAAAIDFVLAEIERVEADARAGGFDADGYPSDPAEFEHWCAEQLRRFGWEADVTKRGYDQGIDIVARRGALVVGLQVKRYNSPVGNKAIQEAVAGRSHYGLAAAGVLATAGFTPSARRLAASTQTVLLSPYDLPHMDRAFGLETVPEAWAG